MLQFPVADRASHSKYPKNSSSENRPALCRWIFFESSKKGDYLNQCFGVKSKTFPSPFFPSPPKPQFTSIQSFSLIAGRKKNISGVKRGGVTTSEKSRKKEEKQSRPPPPPPPPSFPLLLRIGWFMIFRQRHCGSGPTQDRSRVAGVCAVQHPIVNKNHRCTGSTHRPRLPVER